MADIPEVTTSSPTELLAIGRRHLAVRDYFAASDVLSRACEALAVEHGDDSDQCAEAYLWYGKALLGVSREESGVLGGGVAGTTGNADEDDEENDEQEAGVENGNSEESEVVNGDAEKVEPESTTKDDELMAEATNIEAGNADKPATSNGESSNDSAVDMENEEEDVDNLQLAWETLDLARSLLQKRCEAGGGEAGRALLADVHLALGEVALESETYDKAVLDMQKCLEIQKELYRSDDRRIAETHYQIGLANSLASNFEDAITHFKNAANILESRIKTLENPDASEDQTVKERVATDPFFTVADEIKELKELLPEIQEKIQDMMDYKAETKKRVREVLCPSNGDAPSSSTANGAGPSSSSAKPAADISHLIKRKRKSSESGDNEGSAPKRSNT